MKYQKIAIWRVFLPKTNCFSHPPSVYPPCVPTGPFFPTAIRLFPCFCPVTARNGAALPSACGGGHGPSRVMHGMPKDGWAFELSFRVDVFLTKFMYISYDIL
jgi:hypothetical protein